jgi:preprotein translocase subunit SecG
MNIFLSIVLAVQVLSAIGVIILVLIQHGKGADMGAAFGSGTSGSLFGASGSANFLSRSTAALATLFFICTLALAFLANKARTAPSALPGSVMEQPSKPAASGVPVDPAKPALEAPASAPKASDAPPPSAPVEAPKQGGSEIPK